MDCFYFPPLWETGVLLKPVPVSLHLCTTS